MRFETERLVDICNLLARFASICTDDKPIGMLEVVNGGAGTQELRIGRNCKLQARPQLTDDPFDLISGPDRYRRFDNDERAIAECSGNFVRRHMNVG